MTKFSLPKATDTTSRSSIRVPKSMRIKMEEAMEQSGYNRKQRSKWIEDITLVFLQRSDAPNLIAEEFIVPGSTEAIPVTLASALDGQIIQILERVHEEEGIRKDRSAVIRTAITQNLLASVGRQLSPRETRMAQILEEGDDVQH